MYKFNYNKPILSESVRQHITDDVFEYAIENIISDMGDLESYFNIHTFMYEVDYITEEQKQILAKEINASDTSKDSLVKAYDDLLTFETVENMFRDTEVLLYMVKEAITEYLKGEIQDLLSEDGQTIMLHRLIAYNQEPEQFIKTMETTNRRIGIYWAKEFSKADIYGGDADSGKNEYMFVTEVPLRFVDWKSTLYLRGMMPEENEVRLKNQVPVKLHQMWHRMEGQGSKDFKNLDISTLKQKEFKS